MRQIVRGVVALTGLLWATAAGAALVTQPAPGVLWREDLRQVKPAEGPAASNWYTIPPSRVSLREADDAVALAAAPGPAGQAALLRRLPYDLTAEGSPWLVLDLAGAEADLWSGLSVALELPSGRRRLLDFAREPGLYLLDLRRLVPELAGRKGELILALLLSGATTEQAGPAVRVRSLSCVAAPTDRLELTASAQGRPLRWSDTISVVAVLSKPATQVTAGVLNSGPPPRPLALDRREQWTLTRADDDGRCFQLTVALSTPASGRGSQILVKAQPEGGAALFVPLGLDLDVNAGPAGSDAGPGARPIMVRWLYPSYRGTLFAGAPADQLVAECRWEDDGGPEVTVAARLLRGEEVVAAGEVPGAAGQAQVMLAPGDLPAGDYLLQVSATRHGNPLATGVGRLRRLGPAPHLQVGFTAAGRLQVNGRLRLPFGWLRAPQLEAESPWWDCQVAAEAAAPGDVSPVVDLTSLISSLPEANGTKLSEATFANLVARVEREASHPRLLAWLLAERPDTLRINPDYLAECYRTVAALDAYHPVLILVDNPDAATRYAYACDGLIVAAPPATLPRLMGEVRARRPEQGVWALPTPISGRYATLRWAYWLAAVEGAGGFMAGNAKDAEAVPVLRLGLRHIANELAQLRPWLLADAVPASATPELSVRAVDSPSPMLVAVNRSPNEFYGRIESAVLKGVTRLQVVGEGRGVNVLNGVLTDQFAPNEVHVYAPTDAMFPVAPLADIEDAVAAAR